MVTAPAVLGPGTTTSVVRSSDTRTTSPGAPPPKVTSEESLKRTPAGAVRLIVSPQLGVGFEIRISTVEGVTRTGTTSDLPPAFSVNEELAMEDAVTWNRTAFSIWTPAVVCPYAVSWTTEIPGPTSVTSYSAAI